MAMFRLLLLALAVWLIFKAVKALRPPRKPEVRPYEDLGKIEDAEYEDIDDQPHSSVSGE
ncbi:MAG: hypothetical protein DRP94_07135 [Candidatus Latescibacterota bacterium]|nr:MAG: hypothetical protein DRP94_07135 [Candidatus Latescibacterota bacterium]RKY62063.1 MAG: hypothetical protein DRP99_06045 [Candidatus Latescibacterota bacterium]RKY65512.1 MAG: hypothetical protein DRQ08_05635 [Candidatus Latescibacterota bacterium]RKY73810.1 MAG: hypothetical protein DRQ14_03400 [Candidatus Latescibacterota bacterium]